MVLEALAESKLVIKCHSADEYAKVDEVLENSGLVSFARVPFVSEQDAKNNPYYYVEDEAPTFDATLNSVFASIGEVPWMTFADFMTALEDEENESEIELPQTSLEDVL